MLINLKKFQSVLWLLYEKLLRILSGVFITAAVARYLGPSQYGILALALGSVAVFSAAAAMGSEHINTAQLSKRNTRQDQYFLNSALAIRLLWSFICLAAFILYINVEDKNETLYWIISISIPMAGLSIVYNKIQSTAQFGYFARISTIVVVLGAGLKILGIINQYPVNYFASVLMFEAGIASVVYVAVIYRPKKIKKSHFQYSWKLAWIYYKLCAPTAVSAVLIAIYLRIELFMVSYLQGDEAAGVWAAAMMFVIPWQMVSNSILTMVNVDLAKHNVSNQNYHLNMIKIIRLMMLISVVAITINILISQSLVLYLFGKKYQGIEEVIYIASFSLIPLFMGSVQEIWVAHQMNTSLVLKKVIIGLPISLLLIYILGSKYGLSGVACSLVMSHLITAIALNYFLDPEFYKLQRLSLSRNGVTRGP